MFYFLLLFLSWYWQFGNFLATLRRQKCEVPWFGDFFFSNFSDFSRIIKVPKFSMISLIVDTQYCFLLSCFPHSVLPNNILQIFVFHWLCMSCMNDTFIHCTNTLCCGNIVPLPFFSNLSTTWELSNSKNWKKHCHIQYLKTRGEAF